MDKETGAAKKPAAKGKSLSKAKTASKPAPAKPAAAKKFDKDDLISCTSVFPGTCILIGKRTGNQYVWDQIGEEQEVFYQDLQAEILNKRSQYVYEPLIVINDPEAYGNKKAIKDLYANVYFIEDVQELLASGDTAKIKNAIRKMPEGVVTSVKSIVVSLIQDGELTDYRAVKAMDDELGTDMAKQFELFG